MLRRTKIIATLGPASSDRETLTQMVRAGVNLVRLNMSHDELSIHSKRIEMIREIALAEGVVIGILLDLQGPKIRICGFEGGKVVLQKDAKFILDPDLDKKSGTINVVGVDYKTLPQEVKKQDVLLLDDGKIELKVDLIEDNKIYCTVVVGGDLSNNKGVNLQGGGLAAETLTIKDKQDIKFAAEHQVDYVGVSFVRCKEDIELARKLLDAANCNASIAAKIERIDALDVLDDIISSADAVMVARGDLGVEIGFAEVPALQKHIITRARELDKAVITATQMMESMIHDSIPTRAEVSDVANAVLDGTDAVMLSAETATGDFPVKVIECTAEICLVAEKQKETQVSHHRLDSQFQEVDEAIAMATMYTANHLDVAAIIAFTEVGSMPLWMSRIRSKIPIYGISNNKQAIGNMSLYRGVFPMMYDVVSNECPEVIREIIDLLSKQAVIEKGDKVIVTHGDLLDKHGCTNVMKVMTV